jgi:hypothetical protein
MTWKCGTYRTVAAERCTRPDGYLMQAMQSVSIAVSASSATSGCQHGIARLSVNHDTIDRCARAAVTTPLCGASARATMPSRAEVCWQGPGSNADYCDFELSILEAILAMPLRRCVAAQSTNKPKSLPPTQSATTWVLQSARDGQNSRQRGGSTPPRCCNVARSAAPLPAQKKENTR